MPTCLAGQKPRPATGRPEWESRHLWERSMLELRGDDDKLKFHWSRMKQQLVGRKYHYYSNDYQRVRFETVIHQWNSQPENLFLWLSCFTIKTWEVMYLPGYEKHSKCGAFDFWMWTVIYHLYMVIWGGTLSKLGEITTLTSGNEY